MSDITHVTICIRGEDAFEFLQAQLTVDLQDLTQENAPSSIKSAWCNPKGRVICILDVSLAEDGYDLSLPADLADSVMPRLAMFRFRSKVEFAMHPGTASSRDAALQRLRAGIVQLSAAQSEEFTPHMLNLDVLGIVSLDKGCYPGQEIVARTHYRGASKRRCLRFTSSEPLAAGDKVMAGERAVGEVVNAIGTDLLAVVPLTAAEAPLTVGDVTLHQQDLPYAL